MLQKLKLITCLSLVVVVLSGCGVFKKPSKETNDNAQKDPTPTEEKGGTSCPDNFSWNSEKNSCCQRQIDPGPCSIPGPDGTCMAYGEAKEMLKCLSDETK